MNIRQPSLVGMAVITGGDGGVNLAGVAGVVGLLGLSGVDGLVGIDGVDGLVGVVPNGVTYSAQT